MLRARHGGRVPGPRCAAVLAALAAVVPLVLSPPVASLASEGPELRIVGFEPGLPAPLASLGALGARVVRVDELLHFAVVVAADPASFDVLASRLPGVAYVEPDFPVMALGYQGLDPLQPDQWGLDAIRAPQAWAMLPERHTEAVIAILDTGADWHHPDLEAAVWNGNGYHGDDLTVYATLAHCALDGLRAPGCFYLQHPPEEILGPMDFHGHGTHVAAIAGAVRDGVGLAGVAPAMLRIVKVLPLGNSVFGSIDVVASGIAWAASQGARVISLSLGCACNTQTLQRAVEFAWTSGSLLVAAAGNSNSNAPMYPASFPQVLSVAATNSTGQRWVVDEYTGSNFGPNIDLAAPGAGILSAQSRWSANFGFFYVGLGFKTMSGTSMAAPFVAGVAALVWEAEPRLTNAEVRGILEGTASDLGAAGRDDFYGWGLVDAEAAVRAALGP